MSAAQSSVKWPNVPDVYRWLSLDQRGNWLVKGKRITHDGLNQFISANYHSDEHQRWYFQNGPQKVFVTLEYTPFVIFCQSENKILSLKTHTGKLIHDIETVYLDRDGRVLANWGQHIGVICDRDLTLLYEHIEVDHASDNVQPFEALEKAICGDSIGATDLMLSVEGKKVSVQTIDEATLRNRFPFNATPLPDPGQSDC